MRSLITLVVAATALVSTAEAQNRFNRRQTETALNTLAEVGATCEAIRRTANLGRSTGRELIVAIECASNERYVVLVDTRGRMSFLATCEQFEEVNRGSFCFR